VVGRALVLLLQGSNYDVRFLPVSFLSEPRALEDVRLLLLTPMPGLSDVRRKAFLASLKEALDAAETPILELIASKGAQGGETPVGSECCAVAWPCSTQELERRIEAALSVNSGVDRTARRGRLPEPGGKEVGP
jgi:hypothetical protein